MIILEGPDNCGKTTLKNTLLEEFSELFPFPKKFEPSHDPKEMERRLRSFYSDIYMTLYNCNFGEVSLGPVVFDRCYFSEVVYGEVVRDKVSLSPREHVGLPLLMGMHKPLVIYCRIPLEMNLFSFKERNQYVDHKSLHQVYDKYDEMFRGTESVGTLLCAGFNVVTYDWTEDSEDFILDVVRTYLKEVN